MLRNQMEGCHAVNAACLQNMFSRFVAENSNHCLKVSVNSLKSGKMNGVSGISAKKFRQPFFQNVAPCQKY